MLAELVRNVCYHNAKNYFDLEPGTLCTRFQEG
jgi:hypothetical protein